MSSDCMCPICFENLILSDKKVNYITSCKHVFHYDCIYKYAYHTGFRTKCPLCLKDNIFTLNDTKRSFLYKVSHGLRACNVIFVLLIVFILIPFLFCFFLVKN